MSLDDLPPPLALGKDELLYFGGSAIGYVSLNQRSICGPSLTTSERRTPCRTEIKREPCFRADRAPRLVFRDILIRPGPKSIGIVAFEIGHVACRVLGGVAIFGLASPREELPQRFDTGVGRSGKGRLLVP